VDVGVDEPGQQDLVVASSSTCAPASGADSGSTAAIRPSVTPRQTPRSPDGVTARAGPDHQVVRAHDSPPADTPTGK
jgi:hypothetical protein